MGRTKIRDTTELTVTGIEALFEKTVTKFGSGAKIDCPKQYLGRDVYVVVRRPDAKRSPAPTDEA